VIPTFVAQFGLASESLVTAKWRSRAISDDPVKVSNQRGFVNFAMSSRHNSRTTQLFVNYADNSHLDSMGFAPFGEVNADGMAVLERLHNCGEKPDQDMIKTSGNAYLDGAFPELSQIVKVMVLRAHSNANQNGQFQA